MEAHKVDDELQRDLVCSLGVRSAIVLTCVDFSSVFASSPYAARLASSLAAEV